MINSQYLTVLGEIGMTTSTTIALFIIGVGGSLISMFAPTVLPAKLQIFGFYFGISLVLLAPLLFIQNYFNTPLYFLIVFLALSIFISFLFNSIYYSASQAQLELDKKMDKYGHHIGEYRQLSQVIRGAYARQIDPDDLFESSALAYEDEFYDFDNPVLLNSAARLLVNKVQFYGNNLISGEWIKINWETLDFVHAHEFASSGDQIYRKTPSGDGQLIWSGVSILHGDYDECLELIRTAT